MAANMQVTIMGGGIFGLALAHVCAARGARVEVRERRRIGAGASGGLVGALAPHTPENWTEPKALQLSALLMAGDFWAEVRALCGVDPGYLRAGRVQPLAPDGIARARDRATKAATLWQGRAKWEVRSAADLPGLAVDSPGGLVIHDTLSARLHPRRALQGLAAAIRARGGTILEGCAVPPAPGARHAVIQATGFEGLAALADAQGRAIGSGVKGQALLLRHAAPDSPQVFAGGLHIVPHADGTVAIGATSERDFDDAATTDAQCDALLARAIAACPALANAPVIERWAGVRPRARSRNPVLGACPGRPGEFVFNGGFKTGFAMAPLLAGYMADLVLDGRDTIPESLRLSALS